MLKHAGGAQLSLRVHVSRDADVDAAFCRDEHCRIKTRHAAHPIIESKGMRRARIKLNGWIDDPFEPMDQVNRKKVNHSPLALQHSIVKATSLNTIKPFAVIMRDVLDDYGSVTDRTVYRTLPILIEQGRIVYLRPAPKLYGGYLRAGSELPYTADGLAMMADQIRQAMSCDADR